MEYQKIREVVQEHFKSSLDRHQQRIAVEGRLSEVDKSALMNGNSFAIDALERNDYNFVGGDDQMIRIIDTYTLPIKPETKGYATLRTEFLKGFRDYCTAALNHDSSMDSYNFTNKEAAAPTAKLKARKLVPAIEMYCEEKLRLKQWKPHIAEDYKGQFALLLRYLGNDASIHISSDLASDVKNMLLRLPKNMGKKAAYKDKSIAELIAMDIPASDRLNAVTVAKYIRTISTFYDWAVKRKDTNENNFSALVDNVKKAYRQRDEFEPEDIRRIFEKVLVAKKPHQKWIPLIAFYTGARLNEIAQLETKDIVQEDGVWCFKFTDEGDESKRLKNQSSKRFVPIHSYLLNLKFLEFVTENGKGMLFKELTYHPKDGYGRNIGRWFNMSLLRQQLKITSPTLVFHSIRHTVAQQLRNKKVFESTLKDILGHSQIGVTLETYANNLDKNVMQEAIEKLAYP